MPKLKCKRCGHAWPSKVVKPKSCPGCKSYKWDKEPNPKYVRKEG